MHWRRARTRAKYYFFYAVSFLFFKSKTSIINYLNFWKGKYQLPDLHNLTAWFWPEVSGLTLVTSALKLKYGECICSFSSFPSWARSGWTSQKLKLQRKKLKLAQKFKCFNPYIFTNWQIALTSWPSRIYSQLKYERTTTLNCNYIRIENLSKKKVGVYY